MIYGSFGDLLDKSEIHVVRLGFRKKLGAAKFFFEPKFWNQLQMSISVLKKMVKYSKNPLIFVLVCPIHHHRNPQPRRPATSLPSPDPSPPPILPPSATAFPAVALPVLVAGGSLRGDWDWTPREEGRPVSQHAQVIHLMCSQPLGVS